MARLPAPLERPRLRLMTCGSVDDGKSTLIGRLLFDSGAIFEDHLAEVVRSSGSSAPDFSFFVDGLKAEREQGITIDVAYRYFTTSRRAFLIADAPGHEQYTRNQAAAASQSELAIVLVSARDGIRSQTRRHMAIAAMFGLRHIVIAVNKMDLVDYDEAAFRRIADELREIATGLGLDVVAAIPVVARDGDNVVKPSASFAWYNGATVLGALEDFELARDPGADTIFPVALTGRTDGGGRVSYGEISSGTMKVGQSLRTESGLSVSITRLWQAGEPADCAVTGDAVAVELSPEVDLGRGAVLSERPLPLAIQIRTRFVWLSAERAAAGHTYDLQIGTGAARATIARLEGRLDLQNLAVIPIDSVSANDIVVGRIQLAKPLPVMPFDRNRRLGSFILIDRVTRRTMAAGVVLSIERQSGDTPWQTMQVTAADRAESLAQKPVVIWLTGLSGAGKSTIADLLQRRLHERGRHAMVLDGDNLRHGISADLGFSEADRSENIRRVGHIAALMADAGLIVIVSLISPFRRDRKIARDNVGPERFIEVFVDAPLEVCQQRDPKGMYARAAAGTLARFTGVSSDYEPPADPDLHLRTDRMTAEEAAAAILDELSIRAEKG